MDAPGGSSAKLRPDVPENAARPDNLEAAQMQALGVRSVYDPAREAAGEPQPFGAHIRRGEPQAFPRTEGSEPPGAARSDRGPHVPPGQDRAMHKHWGKALAAVLRHEMNGQWVAEEHVLNRLHSSKRYGVLDGPRLREIIWSDPDRFVYRQHIDEAANWKTWYYAARPEGAHRHRHHQERSERHS